MPDEESDIWTYIWGSSTYTSRKAYKHLKGNSGAHPVFKWIWNSTCQHNHKVFFGLLIQDRLSTCNILRRKHFHLPSFDCALCAKNLEETREHLFLWCSFSESCWSRIGLSNDDSLDPLQIFESFKTQMNVAFYMEIIIIMSWSIWTIRNDAIFRGIAQNSSRCIAIFKQVFGLLLKRAKKKYFPHIESWLEQFV